MQHVRSGPAGLRRTTDEDYLAEWVADIQLNYGDKNAQAGVGGRVLESD